MERLTKRVPGGIIFETPIGNLLDRLATYEDAEQNGRLVVLDNQTALAIAAGERAIRTTKRLHGATYVYDPFGEDGGPYEIPYAAARKILFEIWQTCPLVPAQQTKPEGVE